ncbi:MAG: hypothetical protein KC431_20470 [Myxococcales bacterium]|nr:hypothetical protein [Myxococcales bacterium]
MSKHRDASLSRSPRLAGLMILTVAAVAAGTAIVVGDDAMAGPGSDPLLDDPDFSVAPSVPQEDQTPWTDPDEVERLSIPYSPEEMAGPDGWDPNQGPGEAPAATPTYIFINIDGTNLTCQGGDNSLVDSSIIACQYGFSGPYPGWGGTAAQRQTLMDAVKADWAPFNMAVVSTRPANGPYTMCMTGPGNHPFGNNVLGIAPLDCNNNMPNNIVFAFHSANDGFGANTQATTISQEVAHAYGLEHVGATSDIMNPYNAGGNPSFTDTCINIQGNPDIVCNGQHLAHCSSGKQNSYQELLSMFGAADPDNSPPTVAVTYPNNGDVFPVGADFQITCNATDDVGVASVELYLNGSQAGSTVYAAPYAWDVNNLPLGDYQVYCVATDEWSNTTQSTTVSFSAQEDQGGTTGGGTTGGDTTGGDTTSGGESGTDTTATTDAGIDTGDDFGSGGLPPGFGQDVGDSGCACNSGAPAERNGWMLLGLLALPLLRRRRD